MNTTVSSNNRLRELDFLRGLAIVLVLIRHSKVPPFLLNIGWVGVDLFFVLSGFLVSGLLFKEYKRYGNIHIKRFLIRRGFKIYPLFYITAIPYIALRIIKGQLSLIPLLGDLTFLQNYVSNWGYLYKAGWSLAVEEHFYLGIAAILFISYKKSWFKISTQQTNKWFDTLSISMIALLFFFLLLRYASNLYLLEGNNVKNFTLTHLRIDSLLAGVLLSYGYYFKQEKLKEFYFAHTKLLLVISFLCLVWLPFIDPLPSFFVRTLGFTLLYVSFSILLLCFIMDPRINKTLDTLFTKSIVSIMSKIGYCSYSIYIIHILVNTIIGIVLVYFNINLPTLLVIILTNTMSIFSGFVLTKYVEEFVLTLRNKYFPSRVSIKIAS